MLHLVLQREAGIGYERLVRGHDAGDQLAHIDHFLLHRRRAALQTRKLQDGVYQAAEALHLGVHRFQPLLVGLEHAVHHRFHGGLDGHQRRTQLMCHVGGQTALQLAVALDGVGHRIERLAQVRDLVLAVQLGAGRQIAFLDGLRRGGHAVDGADQRTREQEADA